MWENWAKLIVAKGFEKLPKVKQETSCTVILPSTVWVLWSRNRPNGSVRNISRYESSILRAYRVTSKRALREMLSEHILLQNLLHFFISG